MATLTGLDIAHKVLDAVGQLAKPAAQASASIPDDFAPLDVQLLFLQAQLKDIVAAAPELNPVALEVDSLVAGAPSVVTTDDLVGVASRVQATSKWLLAAAPPIKAAVSRADPAIWIPELADGIVKKAWEVKGWRADCVVKAWSGGPVAASWQRAEDADKALNNWICDRYLHALPGIQGHIDDVVARRQYLLDLKSTTTHTPLTGSPGPDDVNLGASNSNGQWPVQVDLVNDLNLFRSEFDMNTDGVYQRVLDLNLRVQRIAAMITALSLREEIVWAADRLRGEVDRPEIVQLVAHLDGYDTELGAIVDLFHQGFVENGGPSQAGGIEALVELSQRVVFVADRDWALTEIQIQDFIKTVLIAAGVLAIAAFSAGAAASMAGAAVAAFGGEAGAVFLGSLAAEAFVFTMVSRSADSVLYGEQALQDTPFWEDLLWNAAMIGGLKVAEAGYSRIFSQVAKESAAYKLGLASTRQLTLLAFGEVRQRARTGAWPTLGATGQMALEQMAITLVLHLAGGMSGSFTSRNQDIAGRMDPATVQQLDQGANDLAAKKDSILKQGATSTDIDEFSTAVQQQWQAELIALEAMDPNDPARPAALAKYAVTKAEAELLLAANGFDPALGNTGQPPTFAPKGPGIVSYTADGRPVIDKVYKTATNPTAVVETPVPGVLIGTGEDGRLTCFVPAEVFAGPPPRPQDMLPSEVIADEAAAASDLAQKGRDNLTALTKGRIAAASVLAALEPEHVAGLLELMSHPFFDPVANAGQYSRADLVALGKCEEARWFAANHSVKLALKIKIASGGQSQAEYGKRAVDLLRSADALIDPAPDPAALTAELEQLGSPELRTRLLPAKPKAKPRPRVTEKSLGVDNTSDEWKALRELQRLANPQLTEAQLDARADVDQAVEASRRNYKVMQKWTFARRLVAIDTLTKLMGPGNYDSLPASNIRGLMVERLFIPDYKPGQKLRFKDGRIVAFGTGGASEPDWLFDFFQQLGVGEIKSDRVDQMTTAAQVDKVATDYGTDGMQDLYNAPAGAHYRLFFVQTPASEALVQTMVDTLRTFPWRGTADVVFGERAPISLTPGKPAP